MSQSTGDVHRRQQLLEKKLRTAMLVPAVLGLIQLTIALFQIASGDSPVSSLLWVLPGLVVGYPFGRKVNVDWNTESGQVLMVGGQAALTVAFVALVLVEKLVLKHALRDVDNVATIVLLVTVGLIYGRLVGLYQAIKDTMAHRHA